MLDYTLEDSVNFWEATFMPVRTGKSIPPGGDKPKPMFAATDSGAKPHKELLAYAKKIGSQKKAK